MHRRRGARVGKWMGLVLLGVVAGCATVGPPPRLVTNDPNATLLAREQHPGIVLERLGSGATGELVPLSSTSQAVRLGGQDVAWLTVGEQEVTARSGPDATAPVLGRVVSTWDDQAIRLAIEPAGKPPIQSDVFRSGVGSGQILLSRDVAMALDLRGAFTSPLRAADGSPVGWLRVRIGATGGTSFEGAMPTGLSDAMAAATVAALQHEVGFIENQLGGDTRPKDDR